MDNPTLDRRCLACNHLLPASTHVSANERKKRDAAKIYCGGPCAAKHRAMSKKPAFDQFLYAK